jgi:hypothetical protein
MAHGREVSGGAEIASGGREASQPGDRPPRTDEEFDRRARYLAKAASLGHVVSEDESADRER